MRQNVNWQSTAIVNELRRWATEKALPLWAEVGWDARLGCFHEQLTLDGEPNQDCLRRVRVQARQIYVYSHAAAVGWYPDGKELALQALDGLLKRYRSPDGFPGFVHTLSSDGRVANALRDTYDTAFILLGLAWLARASADAQVRALIDEVLAFLDEHLAASDGTFLEGVPASDPRRQNPHMHLFEAMLALHETIAHSQALQRAARLRTLLTEKFIDPASGTLGEYFDAEWRPWRSSEPIEPGHHAEWSWLLRRHERLASLPADPIADHLRKITVQFRNEQTGLLPDGILSDGTQPARTHRCWPQCELAKAWLAEHERGGSGAGKAAASALEALRRYYLADAVSGTWIDRVTSSGEPLVDHIPASTFYHLFSAIVEADRLLAA